MKVERENTNKPNAYEFSCGAVQRSNFRTNNMLEYVSLSMWKEHNVYHVRGHNHETGQRIFWDSFRTVTEARKRFSQAAKEISFNLSTSA